MNRLEIRNFPSLEYECEEAINSLCTLLTASGENIKKIVVTSCHEGEGKTWISMNVARKLSQLGMRVALMEADLRRGAIVENYSLLFEGEQRVPGLTEYLAGRTELKNILYETDIDNVYMIPSGANVSNSLAFISSPRVPALLDMMAQKFDYIIVDAPPAGLISDAVQLAKSCDGALITVQYNTVRRRELGSVLEQLEQVGCPVLGTVLNKVEYDSYMNKRYYYKSYYTRYEDNSTAIQRKRNKK